MSPRTNFKFKGKPFVPALALLGLALAWSPGAPAQPLIASEDFDHGISGWTAAGDPGTVVEWDDAMGSPLPGSLAMTAPPGGVTGENFKAVGQCRSVRPAQAYTVEARIRTALGSRRGSCFATPVFYDQADCQGDGSIGGTGDAFPVAEWLTGFRSHTSFNSSQSMRVELVMSLDAGEAEATCHFDSIRLYLGRFREPVPLLSLPWLLVLGLALAATAWMRGFRSG